MGIQKISFLSILVLLSFTSKAQVTIGSNEKPVEGALLQLKNLLEKDGEEANSTKGLLMPRVNLTTLSDLDDVLSAEDKASDSNYKNNSRGLWVYNTNDCLTKVSGIKGAGLYVWDGSTWEMMGEKAISIAPSNTDEWGTKVLRHTSKVVNNKVIYHEFISASFGAAGRWMVTNLAAESYDAITHSSSVSGVNRILEGPKINSTNKTNTAYWAYPGNGTDPAQFNSYPALGYLYTWDAATAGKGSIPFVTGTNNGVAYATIGSKNILDGEYNLDKYGSTGDGWSSDHSESSIPYWTGSPSSRTNTTQLRRQGICPSGWHLPSDYEWTELEQEIIRNTTLYADVVANINSNGSGTGWVPQGKIFGDKENDQTGTDEWRGTTHGLATDNFCTNQAGKGNMPVENGFNWLRAGYYDLNSGFGGLDELGTYWTSSIAHGTGVYARMRSGSADNMYRYKPYRSNMYSVRCKKD